MVEKHNAIRQKIQHSNFANQLSFQLQPIYALNSQRISHVEILARWFTQDLGLISPEIFIPIAEQVGVLHLVGQKMLTTVCDLIKNEKKIINSKVKFNINISPSELTFANYDYWKGKLLSGNFIEQINLELTEQTNLVNSSSNTIEVINMFQKLGLALCIDDFGSGYSGFHYLRLLDADYIKLDRHLIEDITIKEKDKKLIKTIITLAHDLNLQVVAEGVECKSQYQTLKELDCDFVQGYYMCRPLDISNLLKLF
ncbi:EAL domain-containing protein [Undibacterium crateris]|uniref:EAL domain-containing protein n=1 Tax=Undibacterium crateris TaxID=2528175 RepID=UPI00138A500D|nr:EAL domain-containing protein [Undibacterium crateris]NDI87600.1 EAL domain-containing protein [Undibacterium crateris]